MQTRGQDRRQQPRRHEEALLHYAEQNLLAAALVAHDTRKLDRISSEVAEALRSLDRAADVYRHAQTQAARANRGDADARWYEQHDGWVR